MTIEQQDVVERAAKAIHAAHMAEKGPLCAWPWEEASKEFYNRLATAALSALTSPAMSPTNGLREALERIAAQSDRAIQSVEQAEGRMDAIGDYARAVLSVSPAISGEGESECAVSPLPSGKHQVDTSMESGPNNCFFCDQPL